jgi:hypothetical protein
MTINYEIKMNVGSFKGKTIETEVELSDFDYGSLIDHLIENDYLDSYSNNNEFEVIRRWVQ